MKSNYAQILTKVQSTPWLITEEGLNVVLTVLDRHLNPAQDGTIKIDELELAAAREKRGERELNVVRGVGILPITGPIFGKANLMTRLSGATSMETFQEDFNTLLADDMVSSILLQIDSPGGTADLIHEVGDAIFEARKEKPITAIADGLAGSAAYWLASQADSFYSTLSGSVGSIGVYTVHEDRSQADAQAGRKFTYIHAGPYKVEGNPHEPLSFDAKQYRQEVVNELYDVFTEKVARGRRTTTELVKENFGGGRMLTPTKALEAGMIDGIASFDQILNHMLNQPRKVQVAIDGGKMTTATLSGNQLTLTGFVYDTSINNTSDRFRLEHADLEHSEPGTGSPPEPRSDGDSDKAADTGSRRDPLPLPITDPKAPQPNAGPTNSNDNTGDEMDEARLRELLKLSADDSIEDAVEKLLAEVEPMREAIAVTNEEARFAREFPQIYKEHLAQREKNRALNAKNFAATVKFAKRAVGDTNVENTKLGLSALALETIETAHAKFASGAGSLADFEEVLTAMMGGLVRFGEIGSSARAEETVVDTSTMSGIANSRHLFAAKVREIMASDKLDFNAAAKLAVSRYPDLARAWQATVPQQG